MEGLQESAGSFVSHRWSLLSLVLSAGVYITMWLTVNHLYDLAAWSRGSTLAYRLASAQLAAGVLSILIAIVAIRRERGSKLSFIALLCGIVVSGSAAV
jgi:hypothetical protein